MRHLRYIIALVVLAAGCFTFNASAQRMQNGSYSTTGYIKSDGTVQDGSYRTIGHYSGVSQEWAAAFFFFFFD